VRGDHLEDLERAIAQALTKVRELSAQNALPPVLQPLNLIAPPRGFVVHVELAPYTDHAREDDWSRTRWDARNGEVHIGYEPARDDSGREERGFAGDEARGPAALGPRSPDPQSALRDVARVVLRAENDPAFKFLALKFLRDQLLPRQVAWAAYPHEAQMRINYAIDQRVLITSKIENPRAPQYPVTAVRLNREHPVVQELLVALAGSGGAAPGAGSGSSGGASDAEPGAAFDPEPGGAAEKAVPESDPATPEEDVEPS
jgi:hypothetical protein